MLGRVKSQVVVFSLCLIFLTLHLSSLILAQDTTNDAKIIERYKQMLSRKPKEGSTFDRLYQFYLEGSGLDAMVADYQAEAAAKPDNPNPQLILGHIYKRLGRDAEAVKAYQRAVALAPNNYYPHFALGQAYAILLQHENAISALTQAAQIAEATQVAAPPEELTAIYKALGSAYFRRDRINEAIVAWTKIAELDPENIFTRIELADLLREQELYEQAITQHEAIIAFKADDPYRVCLSRREIGNIHEAKGDYEAAIESYDAALALTAPGNWLRKDLQHRIIGIYAADGNWEGLIEYYQKKLETTPNEPELLGLLAAAYIENQQLDEGIATYQKAVELAPTDPNLRLNLIAAFRNAERFEDAAAVYESLSEQSPDDFGIYRELGELYLHLEDEDKARATYQRMINRDPENAGTHLILAEIYASNEWIEDAAGAYQKAIVLAPSNLDYIEYFGEFYFRQGNREKALETWNMMVAADKGIAENYDQLAQLLNTKNFHTEAIAASRKAVELMPDTYRYREVLAKRLMENEDYAAALTAYTEAAKLAPNAFFAEEMDNQRIELYRRQGTLGDKIDTVEEALETPGLSAADIFVKQKQLAKMYLKLGNITYALEVLLKAKTQQPDDIVINRWLAEVYVRQSRRDDANAVYRHLIEIDSANAREYYENIARSYLKVMDFDAATAAAKQAIAHSPRNPEGHQMLAEIAKQSGNHESAIDSLKQALRLRPEAIDTRAELAATFKLSGKPRQALAQYWRCWELSDTVNDKLAFVKPLSEAYYDLGRRGEFEEKLKQLSKSNTSGVGAVIALAELYRMEGDLPSARFQLARALDRERENPDLLAQLVNISTELGDTQDAISYQQRLVKARPDPIHQQQLGKLLFEVGREQEAIQVWTKLLHAKNQTLEAEVKLATLLIRHGLLEEAISVLERAAEKITGNIDAHIALYQLGAVLVGMNEPERAQPYFQRILELPNPPQSTQDTPRTTANTFEISRSRVGDIQRKPTFMAGSMPWIPKTFAEAQAGALVQLTTFAQQHGKLNELLQQFEADVEANPTDIQALETLAQLYTLVQHSDKAAQIIDQLIEASPDDPAYQSLRLKHALEENLNYETLKKALDAMPGLSHEARLQYVTEYAERLYSERKRSDARKLMSELEDVHVTDLSTGITLVNAFVRMDKTEAAEKVIAQLPKPTPKQLSQYTRPYKRLTADYIRDGHIDKAIALLWTFCERTKPDTTNPKRVATLSRVSRWYYSGHTPLLSTYPLPTAYYNQTRLEHLQWAFQELWLRNEQETLYTQLQTALNAAEGRNRIYPSLALSYCYWWDEKRAEAQNVLSELQKEFPNDFTLKLMTAFAAIQTGNHKIALALLGELAESDPRNRHQYSELRLELALHTGDTVTVRELVTKLLNAPTTAPALYHFSQKLRDAGLTQYAIAIAKRAMPLAIGQQSPNFLMELSGHLERLGRGQDAARLAERALQLANRPDRYGRTLYYWNFQRATHLASHTKNRRAREPELVKAIEDNPNSFQAHVKLATFYENTNQIEKASAAFTAALALRPNDDMIRHRYVQMLKRTGKAGDAVPHYTILLRNNSNALGYGYREAIDAFFQADKVDELIALAKDLILPVGQYAGNDFTQKVAQRCLSHNRPEAAVEIFEKIIEVHPNWNYVYRELADAYAATNNHEKAIQFLQESQDVGKTGLSETAFVLKLAEFHEASGSPETAIQFLREKLGDGNISNSEVAFVLKLVELYKASGTLEALITEYEAKLAEKPEDAALLYLIANMKLETDDSEGANTSVNQLLDNALSSTRVQWLYSLAEAYEAAGEQDFQIQLLASAVEKLKTENSWNLSEGYQKLGEAYANTDKKEKAQDAFRQMGTIQLLRKDSRNYYDIRDLAGTYLRHEMWDDAEVIFTDILNDLSTRSYDREQVQERLIQIEKQRSRLAATTQMTAKTQGMNIGVQRAFAREYMDRGETEKAIEIYEQIVQAMPEDLESRAQLATLYSRQNLHDQAIGMWNALLETDPENTTYQDGLISSHQTSGKIDEALALAQAFIDANPEVGAHHARLAKLYKDENRMDEAIAAYEKASERTPGNAQIYKELANLYLGKDDLTAAEKAFKETIRYTSQNWERRNLERQLVGIYNRQGKLEEMLQQAETEGTLTPTMQEALAEHYQENGESEKAVDAYQKALDMTPQGYEREDLAATLLRVYIQFDKIDSALEFYEAELLANASSTRRSTSYSSSSGITTYYGGDEAREALIRACKDQGKLEALKTVFEDRREKETDNPNVLEMLAEIYRNANDHEQAAEAYQALSEVQASPKNVRSAYYAVVARHQNQQPELAEEQLKHAETMLASSNSARSESFLGALATICFKGKMYAPAIKLVNDAVTEAQSSSNTWELEYLYEILGECCLEAKRYEEAFNAYQQLANIARSEYKRQNAETKMDQASKNGNLYEKWIPQRLKQVQENPDSLDARLDLAKAYEFSDKVDEAIVEYQKLSEHQPDNSQWYKKLGALYQKQSPQQYETGEVVESTALILDGNSSFVEIGNSNMLNAVTQQVTVSVWIKPTDFPNRYMPIIFKGDERTSNFSHRSYILYLRDDGKIQVASSPNGQGQKSFYTSANTIELNRWYHIAGVVNAKRNTMQLFINGVEVGKTDFKGRESFYKSQNPLRIGWTYEKKRPTQSPFVGHVDEVRIWNVARTGSEIRADMNTELTGDEPGLIGYWQFDEATDRIVADVSPNKNDGRLIGNAKLAPYTRPIFENSRPEQLTQAVSAYESALQLEPNSYELYRSLAHIHTQGEHPLNAEDVYRRALEAPLTQREHEAALKAILDLYPDDEQAEKHIALLEELKSKMKRSAVLHELLGDTYTKTGDAEKAEIAYVEWAKLRHKEVNKRQRASDYHQFAAQLLRRNITPEVALELAKRATQDTNFWNYHLTLGRAYLANDEYDAAREQFKRSLNSLNPSNGSYFDFTRMLWTQLAQAGKSAKHEKPYVEMITQLINELSDTPAISVRGNAVLAQFYLDHHQPEKAKAYIHKTTFIPETAWSVIGPFDNTNGAGYDKAFIPEEATQLDTTLTYDGYNGQIGWTQQTDETFDGYVDFETIFGGDLNWVAAYAWTTVTVPDERIVHIHFGSDDQAKIWLNGASIHTDSAAHSVAIDHATIPVTLKPGKNSLLVKVCDEEIFWGFYLRITDADGKPFDDLIINGAQAH